MANELSLQDIEVIYESDDATNHLIDTKKPFEIDTRSGLDRRQTPDRRSEIRFEKNRRSGESRRSGEKGFGWNSSNMI